MSLHDLLQPYVDDGTFPGAVGLIARGDRVEAAAVGTTDTGGGTPMSRDTIVRIASITKPIAAAAAMVLVEDGLMALDDPVERWLPELAAPVVLSTPASPVDDVVPAVRPVTVRHLLTSRAGWGFPSDFTLPVLRLTAEVQRHVRDPLLAGPPDEWIAALARVPLLHQPGEGWSYNTAYDILGVLLARVSERPLPALLAERIFEPLGMADTGFAVPAAKLGRFCGYYTRTGGGLELTDAPDGQWSGLPAFPSAASGLVSTADDWLAFARMLLAGGKGLLSPESVRLMTTDHLTAPQREAGRLYLEGQGWGFGGSVDVAEIDPWNVRGRYGWVGGTGTSAHILPSTGTTGILLTQLAADDPTPPEHMRAFWTRTVTGE
ncbi:serine hydrolase domain-containing protein [Spirillospora sp. NPDC047279]|uniref:serine hydrolase domain-containing protein n=1 Tax=Spirillospora sp. NPDC047279 TaxID=3155478 RepID=UPI0033DAD739